MYRLLVRSVYVCNALGACVVVWLWVRWARSSTTARPSMFRRLSTILSLLSLSMSVLILGAVLLVPGHFSGLHGDEPAYFVFMIGLFAAIAGSVLGSWSVEAIRDFSTPLAWILIVAWAVVMGDLEPGVW